MPVNVAAKRLFNLKKEVEVIECIIFLISYNFYKIFRRGNLNLH